MSGRSLDDLSAAMRAIDFAMLYTRTEDGGMAGRPMSNNRDVAYEGTSHYFTSGDTRTVADLGRDPSPWPSRASRGCSASRRSSSACPVGRR